MEMPASEGSLARRTQVFPRLAKDQSFACVCGWCSLSSDIDTMACV